MKNILFRDKKAVSVMIGYILLIVFAIVIASIVFIWLRTYVPSEGLQCPDGVSSYIQGTSFDCDNQQLNITIRNNGRFDIAGFFVHISNISSEEVATIDLSQYLEEGPESMSKFGNSIIYLSTGNNNINPNDAVGAVFNFPVELGTLYSITLTPTRFQEVDNRDRFVSCGNAGISQSLVCGITGNILQEAVCGNGIIETNEACDDGDMGSGDGCSSLCLIESGWICNGEPSLCGEEGNEIPYFGFESGEQGWEDGGSDYERSNDRSLYDDAGEEGGTYSWLIDDDSSSSYTQQNFSFSGYSQVTIEWYGWYHHFEDYEDDCFELKIDGEFVESWGSNSDDCDNNIYGTQNQWLFHSVTLSSTNYDFDSSVTLRFEGEMDSDNDDVYLDGIRITGN